MSSFVNYCRDQLLLNGYSRSDIANMDETAIWADMPGETTVTTKGVRSVPMFSTGHEKSRVTVCLAAFADGQKLQPFIVFKGKRTPKELSGITGVKIGMTSSGWMNTVSSIEWLETVWGKLSFSRRLLIWDSFRAHVDSKVKEVCRKQTKTDMVVIPGGCTSLLQPADVSWNKPFKNAFRACYEKWMREENFEYSSAGNVKSPSRVLLVNWIKEAWRSVSAQVIINSFDVCGITTHDVDVIHCTKTNQTVKGAREAIMQWQPGARDVDLDDSSDDTTSDSHSEDLGTDDEGSDLECESGILL